MIGVINNSREQYDQFVKAWVCSEDVNKFRSITRDEDINGVRFTDVIRIGSYYFNKDHDYLYAKAMSGIRT